MWNRDYIGAFRWAPCYCYRGIAVVLFGRGALWSGVCVRLRRWIIPVALLVILSSSTFCAAAVTVTVNQASGQADPAISSPVHFTAVFSQSVAGFMDYDVILSGSAGATEATVTDIGNGMIYDIAVSGMTTNGTVIAQVPANAACAWSFGGPIYNTASTSTDNVITFNAFPTVTINQVSTQADPTNRSPINFTVVFSRAVTDFNAADVSISGTAPGTKIVKVTGSGSTYNVAVGGMTAPGTVVATIAGGVVMTASGFPNLPATSVDNTVSFDNVRPKVTINHAAAQADPTCKSPIMFSAVFSEPVTDFATGDVVLSGSAGATTAVVAGGGATYTITVSGMSKPGTVIATLAAGVGYDAAGNSSLASTSSDNVVAFDNVRPTVTINQSLSQPDPTTWSPISFTVAFSKPVTAFTADDVVISGTAAGTKVATVTGSGTDYSVSVSGMTSSGSVIASIPSGIAKDAVGNLNLASTSVDKVVYFKYPMWKPQVMGFSPSSGPLDIGVKLTFTSVYRDADGCDDISKCCLLVNNTLNSAQSICLWYDRVNNLIYLKDDANTGWGRGFAPGSSAILVNSQCVVYLDATTVTVTGNNLTIAWSIRLKSPMAAKNLYSWMYVADSIGNYDGWEKVGTHLLTTVNVSPGVNTISDAIESAMEGAKLFLAPGQYTQTVPMVVSGKSLVFVPKGIVTVDCTGLEGPSLDFRNSASVVQGSASAYLQIGTDAPGSGGSNCGIAVSGQVSETQFVTLNYVRVTHTDTSTAAAIRANSTANYPLTSLACYDCRVLDVGQDGFSCSGLEGDGVTMTCQHCFADGVGEDGFTAHQKSVMNTSDCEAQGGQTGFAPAFGCVWTSKNDYLHDNDSDTRKSNLYLVGGPNFAATGLRLGGVTGYHIRLAQYSDQPTVSSLDGMTVKGNAANWLFFGGTQATGLQTLNITNSSFGGIISGNGMDDCNSSSGSPVRVNLDSCTLAMNGSGKQMIASQPGKGTAWNIVNCLVQNTNAAGNGVLCLGNVSVHNCSIEAGLAAGIGVTGAGYNAASGSNTITAKTPFADKAMPQTGDTVNTP